MAYTWEMGVVSTLNIGIFLKLCIPGLWKFYPLLKLEYSPVNLENCPRYIFIQSLWLYLNDEKKSLFLYNMVSQCDVFIRNKTSKN